MFELSESEWKTRKARIDPRLAAAGWTVVPTTAVFSAAAREGVARLRQAILAKAFRGELVPTEAEAARGEGRDYEPASVLLERIRQERAAPAGTAKTNGRPSALRNGRRTAARAQLRLSGLTAADGAAE